MPQFTSTKQMVLNELAKLYDISDINQVLRKAAFEAADMVSARVQQQGKDSDEAVMKTKSASSFGSYSEAYGKKRKRKGFQTEKIDFTFTGDLFEAWRVFPLSRTSIGVGFFGQEVQKSRWLEDEFGIVFELSKDEEADVLELITFEVNKILLK